MAVGGETELCIEFNCVRLRETTMRRFDDSKSKGPGQARPGDSVKKLQKRGRNSACMKPEQFDIRIQRCPDYSTGVRNLIQDLLTWYWFTRKYLFYIEIILKNIILCVSCFIHVGEDSTIKTPPEKITSRGRVLDLLCPFFHRPFSFSFQQFVAILCLPPFDWA